MKVVKLDAIDSTNDFLKNLLRSESLENYMVVTAEHQTNGKGQRGATWSSESGKNLIISMLIKDFIVADATIFDLNIAVSLAVHDALSTLEIPKLKIKWPNDIMSDGKKIGGILIENSFKGDSSIESIVGIGLNVNQLQFENLPKASSLAIISGSTFDKEMVLNQIVQEIIKNTSTWNVNPQLFKEKYTNLLFRKGEWTEFQTTDCLIFNGKIIGITNNGQLTIENESGAIRSFDIKEVKMIF